MDLRGKLSAGVVVVRLREESPLFLLLRAYRNWDFPKGIVESTEDPLQAAVREVTEETTLEDLDFKWGHAYCETGPYSRGKVARYYIAETRTARVELPVNPQLGRPEHHEYRWATFEEAFQLAAPRLRSVLIWAANVLNLRTAG